MKVSILELKIREREKAQRAENLLSFVVGIIILFAFMSMFALAAYDLSQSVTAQYAEELHADVVEFNQQ